MNIKKIGMGATALAAGTLLALAVPLSASAHVGASATSTAAGSYTVVTISVPHGVEDQPTQSVTIDIPASILSVTPTVNPNWTISTVTEPLEPPTEDQTERTAQVIYTAKAEPLDAHQRDTFELSLKLPEGEAGDVVEFRVVQTAPDGATAVWEGDEVPSITLTAAVSGDDHHAATPADEDEHAEAVPATASGGGDDVLARVLGIAGLVLGAVGIAFGVTARRTSATK
ncbi:DUF1775 domain-containing protein [Leifsonia sp. H3M29-4]|uniref:YcnI family copper-binding membrane protein n=1 Tax=Salinibacterium metalliresistens TaxID=3031321 RepID=UPI0023DA0C4E|nr:DUF1775 domain-containing protein [Salinibacterium metalliresistens]MDF1478651.1 DUF1775 domain-containing protein [Salinibacterium metalliresistens]